MRVALRTAVLIALTVALARTSIKLDHLNMQSFIWSLIFLAMVVRTDPRPYAIVASAGSFAAVMIEAESISFRMLYKGIVFFLWFAINGIANKRTMTTDKREGIGSFAVVELLCAGVSVFMYLIYPSIEELVQRYYGTYIYTSPTMLRMDLYCTVFSCFSIMLISECLFEMTLLRSLFDLDELRHSKKNAIYIMNVTAVFALYLIVDHLVDGYYSSAYGRHISVIKITSGENIKMLIYLTIAAAFCKWFLISKRRTNSDMHRICENEKKISDMLREKNELNKRLEKSVIKRTNQLDQAYSTMESYSYTVSHELKTPIREIDTYLEILEEDNADILPEQSQEDIRSMRRICSETIRLVQNMLDYAKVDYKLAEIETINMTAMVRECFDEICRTVPQRSIELHIDELPPQRGDRFLMKQLVFNIISNSVKFTKSKENAQIFVHAEEIRNGTEYFFRDNGVGFDKAYASHIFGIFERIHNESEYEGSGIGLATVKKIAERFGGTAEIDGKLNEGCTVKIWLPKEI